MRNDISSFGKPGHLPFDNVEEEFVQIVSKNKTTILNGSGGSGKTLRGPVALAKAFPGCRIAVTALRRSLVYSLPQRAAFEQGTQVGKELVGYYLAREGMKAGNDTQIIFQIDQSLLNRALEDRKLPEYNIAFIDEQHVRTMAIDILQGSLDAFLARDDQNRIVISTATPDIPKLTEYFSRYGNVGVVNCPTRPGKVETRWGPMHNREHHFEAVCRWMRILIEEGVTGKVNVWLPGKGEIFDAIDFINDLQLNHVDAIPCYGEQDVNEQLRIFDAVDPGRLRFTCSTEITETSYTVPDWVGGIDSMQVFRRILDDYGVPRYTKVNIAQDASLQRMMRFGRITGTTGFYIPIIGFGDENSSQQEWNRLPRHTLPQIQLMDPEDAILTVEAMGISVDSFPWMSPIPEDKCRLAVANLKRIGALDTDGRITEKGKFCARFPGDASNASSFLKAHEFGDMCTEYTKIGIGIRGNDSPPFRMPGKGRDIPVPADMEKLLPETLLKRIRDVTKKNRKGEEYTVRMSEAGQEITQFFMREFAAGTKDDLIAAINAYLEWCNFAQECNWDKRALRRWCDARRIDHRVMWRIRYTVQDINYALEDFEFQNGSDANSESKNLTPEMVIRALAAGSVNDLAKYVDRSTYRGIHYTLIAPSTSCAIQNDDRSQVILYSHPTLAKGAGRKGSNLRFAGIVSPVSVKHIIEDNPQLCEFTYEAYVYDVERDQVDADQHTTYVHMEIDVARVVRTGDDEKAVAAFARALAYAGQSYHGYTEFDHPWREKNEQTRLSVHELYVRSQQQIAEFDLRVLERFYLEKLRTIKATSIAEVKKANLDLHLTVQDIERLLEINDFEKLKKQIEKERPLECVICGTTYPLEYSTSGATLRVPVDLGQTLSVKDLPHISDCQITIVISDADYQGISVSSDKLEELAEKIETRRLDLAWSAFKKNEKYKDRNDDTSVFVPLESSFPSLPDPAIWDDQTQSRAYPAFYLSCFSKSEDGVICYQWFIHWYRTKDDAEKANSTAHQKKTDMRDEEYEKANFDSLKTKAQNLIQKVQRLSNQIDWHAPEVYGLSEYESSRSYGLRGQLSEVLYWIYTKPLRAKRRLEELLSRFETTLAVFAENEKGKAVAEKALEKLGVAADLTQELHNEGFVVYSDWMNIASTPLQDVRQLFEKYQYGEAAEKAEEALPAIENLNAVSKKARDKKRHEERNVGPLNQYLRENLETFEPFYRDRDPHMGSFEDFFWTIRETDPIYQVVMEYVGEAGPDGDSPLVELRLGEQVIASLEAWFDDHNNLVLWWSPGDYDGTVTEQDFSNIEVMQVFQGPDKAEMEILEQISRIKKAIANLERERGYGDRLELTWQKDQRDPSKLFCMGTHTGTIKHIKTNEECELDDGSVKFVPNSGMVCRYAESGHPVPEAGQTWLCTVSFTAKWLAGGDNGYPYVVVANPQAFDNEKAWLTEIENLETELAQIRSGDSSEDTEANTSVTGEATMAGKLAALVEHFNKK